MFLFYQLGGMTEILVDIISRLSNTRCWRSLPVAKPTDEAFEEDRPRPSRRARADEDHRRRRTQPEDDEDEKPRRRRRREDDEVDGISVLIPYKNGRALAAYYCGVFALIPGVGLILGPIALVFGILGLRFAQQNPKARGSGHAVAGIVLGSLVSIGHLFLILLIAVAASHGR
jgi:hypothetical protein